MSFYGRHYEFKKPNGSNIPVNSGASTVRANNEPYTEG